MSVRLFEFMSLTSADKKELCVCDKLSKSVTTHFSPFCFLFLFLHALFLCMLFQEAEMFWNIELLVQSSCEQDQVLACTIMRLSSCFGLLVGLF